MKHPVASPDALSARFGSLFNHLRDEGYYWEPQTPDRLAAYRREAEALSPSMRKYGLGLDWEPIEAGGTPERTAISCCGDWFVAHHHWDERAHREDLVYYGRESLDLLRCLEHEGALAAEGPHSLRGRDVLDLGSGSGALSLALSPVAREILGLELSPTAVAWATASARAQGVGNVRFAEARIGSPEAESLSASYLSRSVGWDAAVFNPPMAIPHGTPSPPRPSRDGGHLGMELPLAFTAFAQRHLRPGGRAYCLITSPVVRGRSLFFDRLPQADWVIDRQRLLEPRFNQTLYRKDGYAELGIERVELWYLCLRKRGP